MLKISHSLTHQALYLVDDPLFNPSNPVCILHHSSSLSSTTTTHLNLMHACVQLIDRLAHHLPLLLSDQLPPRADVAHEQLPLARLVLLRQLQHLHPRTHLAQGLPLNLSILIRTVRTLQLLLHE